jgi:antitoxin component of MazEF toxin-antitoxin module
MIKTISKVGNSQGVIFDAALMELAHLQTGDELNVEVHEGGTITSRPFARARRARKCRASSNRH